MSAAFATLGAAITATDAPQDIGEKSGWLAGNQLANGLKAIPRGSLSEGEFSRLIEFRHVDMNDIDPDLTGYDFCWSSCCLEHLGTLQAGIDFIVNSVERTLKIGGVAAHTTEFNCSSNGNTLESGWTVLYRRKDMDSLVALLRQRGHEVELIRAAADKYAIDGYVDVPPYNHLGRPHLKIELEGYVTTSIGIIVRRGI